MPTNHAFNNLNHALLKCRRTGCYGLMRPYTPAEERVYEAAKYYDVSRSMRTQRPNQFEATSYFRGIIGDRETLENVREALGAATVYDIMYVNLLYEPARSEALHYITQNMTFRFIS